MNKTSVCMLRHLVCLWARLITSPKIQTKGCPLFYHEFASYKSVLVSHTVFIKREQIRAKQIALFNATF